MMRKAKKEVKAIFSDNNMFLAPKSSALVMEEQTAKFDALLEGSELWHLEEFKVRLEGCVKSGVAALNTCFEEEVSWYYCRCVLKKI
jgi:hypothetical protein